jgi:hypothetical protein
MLGPVTSIKDLSAEGTAKQYSDIYGYGKCAYGKMERVSLRSCQQH